MKKNKILSYLLAAFVGVGFVSCLDNDDEYDYRELDDFYVETEGIVSEYTINQLQYLQLNSNLVYEGDPDDIEYTWSIYSSAIDPALDIVPDTISTAQNLDYQVVERPGTYYVEFSATIAETGRRTTTRYFVSVEGIYGTSGLLVLYDTDEGVDFGIVRTPAFLGNLEEGSVMYDIYSQANPDRPLRGEGRVVDYFFDSANSYVYLLTSEDMVRLSTENYSVIGDVNENLFLTPPSVVNPQYHYYQLNLLPFPMIYSTSVEVIVNDGRIHALLASYTGGMPYFPSAKVVPGGTYYASPSVVLAGGTTVFAFDELNGRFLLGLQFSSDLSEFQGMNAEMSKNLNRTLLDYEPIMNRNLGAIMKEKDSETYYLTITNSVPSVAVAGIVADIDISSLTDIQEANSHLLATRASLGFYATDTQLYSYSYSVSFSTVNPARIGWTAAAGETITDVYLMDNYGIGLEQNPQGRYLCVSTWDGTEGTVHILEIDVSTGDVIQEVESYDGFGLIKDMTFNVGRIVLTP